MDRTEMAKKLYGQARKMTIGMAASIAAYGAIGYYLIQQGKAGPAILNAQTYPLVKYGALAVSVVGIFALWQVSVRMFSLTQETAAVPERPVQKLFVRTVTLCAAAELPVFLGMVLVFLGHRPFDYIPFAVVSLAGFALAFPKKEQWVDWLGTDF